MTAESPTATGADVGKTTGEHALPIGTDGETLPAQEIVTGRGFITGKSGAGKSNSVTVLLEELFELGLPALVVDTDGEYHPLKERYDVLHVGGDGDCDTVVDESDADRLAELATGDGVPIILDVSAYTEDTAAELIEAVTRALFASAKRERRPYLLVVEEIQEYLPQRGSNTLSELLTTVAKRGRKHGLGILGASQRPSSVDKDFITQSNWMVWHRLTYDTDTKNAGKNLGTEYEGPVASLGDGEAFLQSDWTENVTTLQFRRKHVRDAGATPSIDAYVETPTVHDTDALLERFDAGDDGDDETAADRDVEAAEYHRRAAEWLSCTVESLRADLEEYRETNKAGMETGTGDKHREHVADIVNDHFGAKKTTLYEEYCSRMADPNGERMFRRYLNDLRDAGGVVFVGKNRGRRYYPYPDDLELPDHVTPADAVVAVRDGETVFDVQQELRIQRRVARKIVDAFDEFAVARADGSRKADNNVLTADYDAEQSKVTACVPEAHLRAAERAVVEGAYPSKAEMLRDGFRHVVETTDAATIDK